MEVLPVSAGEGASTDSFWGLLAWSSAGLRVHVCECVHGA